MNHYLTHHPPVQAPATVISRAAPNDWQTAWRQPEPRRAATARPVTPPWPFTGVTQQSRCRLPGAAGVLTLAAGHIPLIQQHLHEAPYIGVGFLAITIAGLILGQLLLLADTTAVWLCTLALAAADLLGYTLSRTSGLPQIHDDIGNWTDPLGIVCLAAQALTLTAAALHLLRRPRRRPRD